jgi:GGDEF domain-containing protein
MKWMPMNFDGRSVAAPRRVIEIEEVLEAISADGLSSGESAARSIIEAIRNLGFSWEGRPHSIGASIGLAPIRAGCGEVDEIIARADAACYAAKAAGRGCVCVAPDDKSEPPAPLAAAS